MVKKLDMSAKKISNCGVFLILSTWLIFSGCSSTPTIEPLEIKESDSVTKPAEMVEGVVEPESWIEPSVEVATDDLLKWSSLAEAVSDFSAYRRKLVLQFEPQLNSASSAPWKVESVYTFTSSPESHVHEIRFEGDDALEEYLSITIGQQKGYSYLRIPDGSCLTISAEEFSRMNSGIVDPDSYLAGLTMPKLISTGEKVSEQETNHFSLDQNSLPGFAEKGLTVDGHLFVSKESGLPLLLKMDLTGEADFLQDGLREQGILHLEMTLFELTGENEGDIDLNCINSAPYPMPDDAYEVTVLGELITYKTRLSMQELISYYSSELTTLGWKLAAEPTVIEHITVMTFVKDSGELIIELERDPELGVISALLAP